MARQITCPITVMAGSTAIKICRSPLKVPASQPTVDATSTSAAAKSYDSYIV